MPVTQVLCESVAGCPDERFDDDDDDSDYGYYGFRGTSFRGGDRFAPLKPAEQDALLAAGSAVCSGLPAAGASWSDCSWVLPGFGIFALVACVPTGQGAQRACTASYAGRLLSEWQERPFLGPQQAAWRWAVPSGADGFAVTGDATLEIDSPVAGARALLVLPTSQCVHVLVRAHAMTAQFDMLYRHAKQHWTASSGYTAGRSTTPSAQSSIQHLLGGAGVGECQ